MQGLGEAGTFLPRDALHSADEPKQQLAAVGYHQVHFSGSADSQRRAGERIDKAHLLGRSPLDRHLDGFVDEVNLAVEGAFGVGGQLVELFERGKLLGLKRIAAGSEQVERLTVLEEHRLLTLMDNELGAVIEILDRVLPDECRIVALVFDDGSEPVVLDFLGCSPFCYVVDAVADGAGVCRCALRRAKTDSALSAGELDGFVLLRHCIDRLMADGAFCLVSLALVKHDHVAAVRTLAAGELVRADVYDIAAGAVDFFTCKEAFARLGIFAAVRAFYYKFGHYLFLQNTSIKDV